MNCEEFRAAALAGEENDATLRHLDGCPSCRSRAADLSDAGQALTDPSVWEEPSPELAFQVEDLIRNAARGSTAPVAQRLWWKGAVAAAAVILAALTTVAIVSRGAAPDWEVALPATELAPNAVATVQGWNEDSGTRMVVAIDDLDPAPIGFVYEFWLSNGPIHISAGTFHSPGEIELWSGVARTDFPRLWVTLEPIDEDESPSGETVLDTGNA